MNKPLALIVEDNEHLSYIFSKALADAQYDTEIVADGEAAMSSLSTNSPALVLLDLHLPDVSGTRILHQIRADKRLAKTRVLITSGDALMAETLRDEADLVLQKPISFVQLRDLARRLHRLC